MKMLNRVTFGTENTEAPQYQFCPSELDHLLRLGLKYILLLSIELLKKLFYSSVRKFPFLKFYKIVSVDS